MDSVYLHRTIQLQVLGFSLQDQICVIIKSRTTVFKMPLKESWIEDFICILCFRTFQFWTKLHASETDDFKYVLKKIRSLNKCICPFGDEAKCTLNTMFCILGVDFQMKTLILNSTTVTLQLWDTAGQERSDMLL